MKCTMPPNADPPDRAKRYAVTGTLSAFLLAVFIAGCSVAPVRQDAPVRDDGSRAIPAASASASPALQRLADEASALRTVAQSSLGKRFLDSTRSLPTIAPRTVFINPVSRDYYSTGERASLPAAASAKLSDVPIDEERYYYTKYGSPLAYLRVLDLAAEQGFADVAGLKILDFGYGSIGHLRLLASLGAYVTGVDPDNYLSALYSQSRDQGSVPPATGTRRGHPGTISLVHGYWPKDPKAIDRVGGGYDLILSKNTLKKGYVRPERKIDKRQQIDLGVSDDAFLKSIHDALNPGGRMIIYNLYPKPPGPKEKYNPQADGRAPWPRDQFEKAGLRVVAYNTEDHAMARNMGRALKWDRDQTGGAIDLENNLYAMYTIVERLGR